VETHGRCEAGRRRRKLMRRKEGMTKGKKRHDKEEEEENYDDAGDYSQSNVTTVSGELGGPAGA
jgi:hypothetical protein